jgi:hypothetical protein
MGNVMANLQHKLGDPWTEGQREDLLRALGRTDSIIVGLIVASVVAILSLFAVLSIE